MTRLAIVITIILLLLPTPLPAQRQMEFLSRGLLAVPRPDNKVFLSWRLLATDPDNISFNIYRDNIKLNDTPISTSTCFLDEKTDPTKPATYSLRPIID